nr:unnamed protein product [Digitaria exilis]
MSSSGHRNRQRQEQRAERPVQGPQAPGLIQRRRQTAGGARNYRRSNRGTRGNPGRGVWMDNRRGRGPPRGRRGGTT